MLQEVPYLYLKTRPSLWWYPKQWLTVFDGKTFFLLFFSFLRTVFPKKTLVDWDHSICTFLVNFLLQTAPSDFYFLIRKLSENITFFYPKLCFKAGKNFALNRTTGFLFFNPQIKRKYNFFYPKPLNHTTGFLFFNLQIKRKYHFFYPKLCFKGW